MACLNRALGSVMFGVQEVSIIVKYVRAVHFRAQQEAEGAFCLP